MKGCIENGVLEYQVRLEKKSIILRHQVAGEPEGVDVVGMVIDGVLDENYVLVWMVLPDVAAEILAGITHDDHYTSERKSLELSEHTVDEPDAVDRQHTFGIFGGKFAEAPRPAARIRACIRMRICVGHAIYSHKIPYKAKNQASIEAIYNKKTYIMSVISNKDNKSPCNNPINIRETR